MNTDTKACENRYGCERFGRLKKALLHTPLPTSLKQITKYNYKDYLFDYVPKVDAYIEEHARYAQLLESLGVEVRRLRDFVRENANLLNMLPNLQYLHDSSVITSKGAILSKMSFMARKGEDLVIKEALGNLGIPIFLEFSEADQFEGCLALSSETVLVANTERHCVESIDKFIARALEYFKEVIFVDIPKERRFMHPDMIYNRVGHHVSLAYLPAFLHTYLITKEKKREIDFPSFMNKKGIELIEISSDEQMKWGCSFVPLEPNVIINYDISLSTKTKNELAKKGVEIIGFHPDALLAGGGSLRCLTLRLYREPDNYLEFRSGTECEERTTLKMA